MGRPIKKSLFGNTNSGVVSPGGDNNIGGEGVASVAVTNAGDYTGTLPTVSFNTPSIPTGVRATGTVKGKLLNTTTVGAGGSTYQIGDTLSLTGGTSTVGATATVVRVTTRDDNGVALVNGGAANDIGDEYWLESTGWVIPLKVRVTASNAGVATSITVVQNGVWNGVGAAPTGNQSGTFHMGPGSIDGNGVDLVFSIAASAYAVHTVSVDEEGEYTAVPTNAVATTTDGSGTGATLIAHWGVKSVALTENGSGYISASDAAPQFSSGAAAGTSTLQTTQANAIVGINKATGSVVDIVKQESANSYWVNTGSEVILLDLVSNSAARGLYVEVTDSAGGKYWARKIEARNVVIGPDNGTQWNDYDKVKWTFDTPVAGVSVKIKNAA